MLEPQICWKRCSKRTPLKSISFENYAANLCSQCMNNDYSNKKPQLQSFETNLRRNGELNNYRKRRPRVGTQTTNRVLTSLDNAT